MNESINEVSRRRFLAASAGLAFHPFRQDQPETRQATGVKVGEVTHNSALVWMRCGAFGVRR